LFCFGKEECKSDSIVQLTKPLNVVWKRKNNKHDSCNTIIVCKSVPYETNENCIIVAPISSKDNWLMEFWEKISVVGMEGRDDVNVVDILNSISSIIVNNINIYYSLHF